MMSVKLRRKKLADGRTSLYLDIYASGRRQYEFLRLYLGRNRAQNKEILLLANSIRDKRALDLAHSGHGQVAAYRRKVNFVDYFEQVVKSKPPTVRAWQNTLNHLRTFTSGAIPISSVTREWLEEFKAYLLTKVAPNTAHVYFVNIKTALKTAEGKIIDRNPAAGVSQIKRVDTERSFLTLDEIEKLAATECGDPEIKRAFLFCCFTGLRLSDVEALRWENVKSDRLQYRQKKTKGFEYDPLSDTAKEILYSALDNVLPLPSNKVFALGSRTHTQQALKAWVKAAGTEKKVTFHTSRHSFATLSLTSGADLYTVSKLLGHKSLQSTQIYAKIVDQKKRQAVALLPKIKMSK